MHGCVPRPGCRVSSLLPYVGYSDGMILWFTVLVCGWKDVVAHHAQDRLASAQAGLVSGTV
eukprot:scaffold193168_cov15-Tisochrysis_lutea.AAC.1